MIKQIPNVLLDNSSNVHLLTKTVNMYDKLEKNTSIKISMQTVETEIF